MLLSTGTDLLFCQINTFAKNDILCISDEPIAIGESPILKNDNFSKKNFKIELDLNALPKYGKAEIKRIIPSDLPSFNSTTFFDTVTIRYEYRQSDFKKDSVRYIITDYDNNGLKSSAWLIFDIGCKSNSDPLLVKCDQDKIVSTDPNTCKYTFETKAPEYTPGNYNPASKGTAIGEIRYLDIGYHDRISVFAGIYNNGSIIDICETYIEVKDLQKPNVSCSENIFSCVPKVDFNQPVVSDNCGIKSIKQTEGLVSGSNFPVGISKISFEVTDIYSNIEKCSFNVEVANLPNIAWKIPNKNDTLCTSDSPIFLNNDLKEVFPGTWTNASVSSEFNPMNAIPNSVVNVSFKVSHLNCSKSISKNIHVVSPLKPDITPIDNEICKYSNPINLNNYNKNNLEGYWYFDNQLITNILTPSNIILGQHQISFRTQNSICPEEYKQDIIVNNGSQTEDFNLEFCGKSGEFNHYQRIDTALNKSLDLQYIYTNPSLKFNTSNYGINQIKLISFNKLTCSSVSNYTIKFNEAPSKSNAGENIELNHNESNITLNANFPKIGTGKWVNPNQNISIDDINSPRTKINVKSGNSFLIWEIANGNCPKELDSIYISKAILEIPNAFSPNSDGKNDIFTLYGFDKQQNLQIVIFNRWGQKVYSNLHYSNNWDGSDTNGNPLPNDTYYYELTTDYNETIKGKITLRR